MSTISSKLSELESIKVNSNFLRGTIVESLQDSASSALAKDDTQIVKFHGFYEYDDRDTRDERRRQLLEPDYQFMIRARVPGGVCTPQQWLALDKIARKWANGTIRLTTRQAFQFHGVLKHELKSSIRAINDSLLDTIAACGDVNRNVMCTPLPEASDIHRQVFDTARSLSDHLTPHTTAYHEIWLIDEGSRNKVAATDDREPIYGPDYLPRKFKIAFAIPPRNDVDVFAHDLSFIAIAGKDDLEGFNVMVGGGMGATHGDPATYPRLAEPLGFCTPDQVEEVAEAIVSIQRDYGDRGKRTHARLKYTIDDRSLEWLHAQLKERLGYRLQADRPFEFSHNGDRFGWQQTTDGLWHLGLFLENGRIADVDGTTQLSGLRAIAEVHKGEFRLTPNQNVIVSCVHASERAQIDRLVQAHGLDNYLHSSPLRLHSMACVGFPSCGSSMAESERYLPDLISLVEALLAKHNLKDQAITIRMTGCPNGCARPSLAEIGIVGKGPGLYQLHLGAAFNGTRLNRKVRESVREDEILVLLDELFALFRNRAEPDETFGDFILRSGILQDGVEEVVI